MPKIKDLEIKGEKEGVWPRAICADAVYQRQGDVIVHISRRRGYLDGRNYFVTNCNRAIRYEYNVTPHHGSFASEEELKKEWGYVLCPRCGSIDDFNQVLVDYRQKQAWQSQRWEEERKEKERKRQEHLDLCAAHVSTLREALKNDGHAIGEPNRHTTYIFLGGAKFEVTLEEIFNEEQEE